MTKPSPLYVLHQQSFYMQILVPTKKPLHMTWNQLMQSDKLEGINFDKLVPVDISASLIDIHVQEGRNP